MSRLRFTKAVVYHGEVLLGELDVIPVKDTNFSFPNNEIRIHRINSPSERCSPLSVLHTISPFSVLCKLQSSSPIQQINLINLHASCFHENKTAVLLTGNEEIHLVAMPSKEKKFPCFWCFAIPLGLYNSCLQMLNMKCLAIVFDLDETLIVANTTKLFEDKIEFLRGMIACETDPMKILRKTAEMGRYIEDQLLLKHYVESDVVADNGKIYKVQLEEVPSSSDTHGKRFRPVIRLQEKNIVLTRINPKIRDTSVLVKLRPAWEELKSYLTAIGRKRFEVYVCTMAERDYALEMWRLLDPESHLISSKQLSDRVVCVKPGTKKSLLNVFRGGVCHPKMAMVIDDRLDVWEDRDLARVHVIQPFVPYSDLAETANAVPQLCLARDSACNVRARFFREFDDVLIRKVCEISHEDDVISLPPTPDVSNCLKSADTGFVSNGNKNFPIGDGMSGAEVEQRLHQSSEKNGMDTAPNSIAKSMEVKPEVLQPSIVVNPSIAGATVPSFLMAAQRSSLLGNPVRLDRRNLGQPPILSRVPILVSSSSAQPHGGWLVEEDSSRPGIGNQSTMGPQDADPLKSEKLQVLQNPFGRSTLAAPLPVTHSSPQKREEAFFRRDIHNQGLAPAKQTLEIGVSQNSVSYNNKEVHSEAGKMSLPPSHLSIGVLQEIGQRCSAKVEFRSVVSTSKDLQFSVEVLFTGDKIGVGMGKTRKDAQQQAAENALRSLAETYVAYRAPRSGVDQDNGKVSDGNENGFLWDIASPGSSEGI